jgi:hypothetical protein
MAGVPAKSVGYAGCAEPSRLMDHLFAGDEHAGGVIPGTDSGV